MANNVVVEKARFLWSGARVAARHTPEYRNRYVDLLRAASIWAVVLGHWLTTAPFVADGLLRFDYMLHIAPWTAWLTWVFQVMPVFFMVGGYANAASWDSARTKGEGYEAWVAARLYRLTRPVVPLVLLWAGLAMLARPLGVDAGLVADGSRVALVPIWFLSVYIMVVVTVPLTHRAWRRAGAASFWLFALCAVAVDIAGLAGGFPLLRWVNYVFVWFAVHQLGYLWRAGRIGGPLSALLWCAGGLAVLLLLVAVAGYPISMVSVPGAELSNSRPPTVALIALAAFQGGLLLSLEGPARRWLRGVGPWAATILVNRSIMTFYLWHMTVMVLVIGLLLLLGGIGLTPRPGSGAWWISRPLWVAGLGLLLVPVSLLFSPLEQTTRSAETRPLPGWQAVVGAGLACFGMVLLAIGGVGGEGPLAIRLWAVLPVLLGAWLVSHPRLLSRNPKPGARRR
ncbi:MAG: acyltransferase [Inquilinus sp.]|nr:acyltransferase [Inquilinus sp.]